MKNNKESPSEELKELPEADYKEWMILRAFQRCIDSIDASYQSLPLCKNIFLKTLREIKLKANQ